MTDTLKLNESTLDYFVRKAKESFELAYKEAQELNERMRMADGFLSKRKESFILNTNYYFAQYHAYMSTIMDADVERWAELYESFNKEDIDYILKAIDKQFYLANH